jgi:hypothetical protein
MWPIAKFLIESIEWQKRFTKTSMSAVVSNTNKLADFQLAVTRNWFHLNFNSRCLSNQKCGPFANNKRSQNDSVRRTSQSVDGKKNRHSTKLFVFLQNEDPSFFHDSQNVISTLEQICRTVSSSRVSSGPQS